MISHVEPCMGDCFKSMILVQFHAHQERSTWIFVRSTSAKFEISRKKSSKPQLSKTSKIIKNGSVVIENELSKVYTVYLHFFGRARSGAHPAHLGSEFGKGEPQKTNRMLEYEAEWYKFYR